MRLRGVGGEDHSDAGPLGDDGRAEEEKRAQGRRSRPRSGGWIPERLRMLMDPRYWTVEMKICERKKSADQSSSSEIISSRKIEI